MSVKKGFTLAEVLITLAIIGVVAALTIPTLMSNYQKTQYVTQLKQVYSQISQALKLLMADQGVDSISDVDNVTDFGNDSLAFDRAGVFLKKYFKVVKDCGVAGSAAANDCFPAEVKDLNSNIDTSNYVAGGRYCVIIASGASICMTPASLDSAGSFTVDINGLKNPNTAGRDVFSFSFYYDGSIDDAVTPECRKGFPNDSQICRGYTDPKGSREDRATYCGNNSQPAQYGIGCLGKIINADWKMDY